MGIMEGIKGFFGSGNAGSIVQGTITGVADLADRFITTDEDKQRFEIELKKLAMQAESQELDKQRAVLADRQSARAMAPTHKKLQSIFAITFLVFFFILVIAEFGFVGWVVYRAISPESAPFPEWLQVMIGSLLSGILAYLVSMLKEVVGFLFGGSAGGDEATERMADGFRNFNQVGNRPENTPTHSN